MSIESTGNEVSFGWKQQTSDRAASSTQCVARVLDGNLTQRSIHFFSVHNTWPNGESKLTLIRDGLTGATSFSWLDALGGRFNNTLIRKSQRVGNTAIDCRIDLVFTGCDPDSFAIRHKEQRQTPIELVLARPGNGTEYLEFDSAHNLVISGLPEIDVYVAEDSRRFTFLKGSRVPCLIDSAREVA